MELSVLDWSIIVVYFVVSLGIGLAFAGRAGESLSEYFVSGRSMPWWLAGTSMVATTFAADTPLAVTGLVAKHGLAGNWFWWSFALGGMVTVFVYARLWRRAEVMTDVEFVELRYGGAPASALRTIRGVYFSLVVNPIIIGWVTGAMVTVLKGSVLQSASAQEYLVPGVPISTDWWIIIGSLTIVGIYSAISGLWGVAVTDLVQFVVAMGGCIWLAVVAVQHVGGLQALHDKVSTNFGGGEQAFQFWPDFSVANPWMPLHVFFIFLFMQWWATWYPGAEPGGGGYIVQRMASCKDERHAILATLWFQFAHYCLRPWPWLLVAYAALAMFPEIREYAVQGTEGHKPDEGFVRVMTAVSPSGLRGTMVVTFFAAFMSTISTQMNWGASYLICDVYQRMLKNRPSDRHLTFASRIASVIVLILGGIASYLMLDVPVDSAWKLLAALGAGSGAVYMLRWFWWRINAWSEISAMAASLGYYLLLTRSMAWLTSQAPAEGTWGAWWLDFAATSEVQTAIISVPTILTWLAVTFCTAPESDAVLLSFYRKVRPGGPGWKPIAQQAPEVVVDRHLGVSVIAALLGAAIIYLTLPGIGWLLFGQTTPALLSLGGAVVCGIAMYRLMEWMGWERVTT